MNTHKLDIGSENVVLRSKHSSVARVGRILGRIEEEDSERIVLDRLIHERGMCDISGWEISGCYVTELSRKLA